RQRRHAVGLHLAAIGRPGTRAADCGARQIGLAPEEGGDTLARLLGRPARGGRAVHGDPKVDAWGARVARLPPRLAVRRELSLQVGNLGRAQPDEDRQAELAGGGERLIAGRRHADGRVRLLERRGADDGVLHLEEAPVVGEGLALPRRADDLQRLAEAVRALRVRHAVDVVGPDHAAAADAELEAALTDVVD